MIGVILGTRPEIIKMSPVIRECEARGLDFFILHTGQHHSYEMDRVFFEELDLPDPDYILDVGSGTHAGQTAKIMTGVEEVLAKEPPEIVLVQGDTNTVMAGALAASKLQVRVGHIEAGLRSFNRRMPEEINRVLTDHISDYLFAPTENSRKNLLAEGIADRRICVTGNTIVDAVYQNLDISRRKVNVLKDLDLKPREYFLVTAHRQENVDNRTRLKEILKGLAGVQKEFSLPVVFPVHPRTEKRIKELGIGVDGLNLTKPFGFLEFLQLESQAKLVLTDSGGVQEETCVLGVPCATMRYDTERPETLAVGSNVLVGTESGKILEGVRSAAMSPRGWENPYGDGIAGKMIVMVCAAARPQ
ncbi:MULTISPECIES: UDP-N-acetylglucosamine 2-epimerase (non-hydrolyzing) [unclassified Methanoculleus]|uniref:non-hydrolyzing UDP-N-acetylglucosamine 2-epimerase n=1 Tax=unclassified Methanoculleus TaxID=2619537 RepID=UPI0025DE1C01|nr:MULTISPECIES: UDP-N-acetylglucosamine 2-epimerase (non-hydrolyzing) [unclassified Methanoculleus]MCK9316770.1 UDP-N-acetylglucosamine 2-epimerase (non-hydrolyzing) [Methanoculleus sp.]MDD2252769.1 UDP-N-acetylglucosamine 2-epimerase (non-hydrolyzing) [Methanoculleus sp.]MDD2786492.1 UDP-N-acetylglucosamine 2-epimerase (non-hydrolyzing) [Methanoculleus sp.]MDD3215248.1 UDP-N-acetylglucosamine 2-epimerase (non-hydrolyzing) [Methanoculleus sp.]MDD4313012.1 UDP-N-acetylglucosamine 2-epimerase (